MTGEPNRNEFLQSSLTAADDATGFDRPWSPFALMWTAFLGGIPAAGYLYAVNFRRLGIERWQRPTLVVCGLLWLVTSGIGTWWILDLDPQATERRLVPFGLRAIALAGAWLLLRRQRRRWELFTTTGAPAGRLLLPAAIAIVASWLITMVYGLLIASASGR